MGLSVTGNARLFLECSKDLLEPGTAKVAREVVRDGNLTFGMRRQ